YFSITNVVRPAATLGHCADGEMPVGWIADRERARDGRGTLRLNLSLSRFDCRGNRRTTRRLRAEKAHLLVFHKSQLDQLVKRLSDFGDQRTACHGNDNIVGQPPAKLFRDFESDRLR